jgi:hypothetical protein
MLAALIGPIWQNVQPNDPQNGGLNAIFPLLGNIISILLFASGALALIFILIGAFQYVISAGNPQNLAQAKRTITYAIVGLAIVIMALVIVNFVRGIYT